MGKPAWTVDPRDLLDAMKSRRSVRHFTEQEVEPEKLEMLMEAIRFAPTGGNRQEVSVKLIRDNLDEFTGLVTRTLSEFAEEVPSYASKDLKRSRSFYKKRWKEMERRYLEEDRDGIFHHAKTVLVLSGTNDVDPAIAASYAELLAHTMGLGCVYIGFVKMAAESEKVRDYLKIQKQEHVVCVLALGYPAVKYKRTVPRNHK
jgi:nitroreductase